MFIYHQSSGDLYRDDTFIATGYSGHDVGKNNPSVQSIHNVGPIPCGMWTIGPVEDRPDDLGPAVMPLSPVEGTETFDRSGFWIHGDSRAYPGLASHGCIILSRPARDLIATSGENLLKVLSEGANGS